MPPQAAPRANGVAPVGHTPALDCDRSKLPCLPGSPSLCP
jgi:hypothetical protein